MYVDRRMHQDPVSTDVQISTWRVDSSHTYIVSRNGQYAHLWHCTNLVRPCWRLALDKLMICSDWQCTVCVDLANLLPARRADSVA